MDFHARSVDGTIPVIALLFPDEALLAEQDGVGLYDGYIHAAFSRALSDVYLHGFDNFLVI